MNQSARLVVLEGLQPAQDLLHRDLTIGIDLELSFKSCKLRRARPLEPQQHHRTGIIDRDRKSLGGLPLVRHGLHHPGLQVDPGRRPQL